MDIQLIVPQHGRIVRDEDVQKFTGWFEKLEVGVLG